MSIGFSRADAQRIAEVVRVVERMPSNTTTLHRRRNTTPTPRQQLRGKLDGQLNKDGSATMSVWRFDGTETDSGEDITVYDWMLKTGQTIASGKKVVAQFFIDSGRWYVTSAECP